MKRLPAIGGILAIVMTVALWDAPGHAKTGSVWEGHVTHVSTTNIKVRGTNGQELSFIVVPKFNKVFSGDGKTTYQMTDIKPGMWVRVIYDQSAMGARHADRIVLYRRGQPVKSMKS